MAGSIGIWIYDTVTYQEVALLTGHTGRINSVAFSPDGNTIASRDWREIRLWDANTGKPIRTITAVSAYGTSGLLVRGANAGKDVYIGPSEVYSVLFSPDGNTLASGGGERFSCGMPTQAPPNTPSPGIRGLSQCRSVPVETPLPVGVRTILSAYGTRKQSNT